MDLVAAGGLTAGFLVVVLADVEGVARFAVALAFLLLAPGYAFVSALFPTRPISDHDEASEGRAINAPDLLERLVVGSLAAVVVAIVAAFAAQRIVKGISLTAVSLTLAVATVALAGVAWIRRRHVSEGSRFEIAVPPMIAWWPRDRLGRTLLVLAAVVLVVLASIMVNVARRPAVEPSTEFFLETLEGEPFRSEDASAPGEPQSFTAVARNREGIPRSYVINLTVWRTGAALGGPALALESSAFVLHPGQTHRFDANFIVPADADRAEIHLLLADGRAVYRSAIVRY